MSLSFRIALLNLALLTATALAQPAPTTKPHRTAKTLIILVGDSTTAPQNGWGPGFIEHLQGDVQCIDAAVNGRSTKSYINEGKWKDVLELKPDYILIQFGHNDQKIDDPLRGTDPKTTFKENMARFANEARAIGAKPIFVTAVSRRIWTADGKINSNLFDYANPVKELGPQLNVPVIDLHALSIALYEKLGKTEVDKLEATNTGTTPDHTHFNHAGAQAIGGIIAVELPKVAPELAPLIK